MRLTALLACAALAAPAALLPLPSAAEPTEDGARALHAHLTELIATMLLSEDGDVSYPSLDKLAVTVSGDGYDVLLPGGPIEFGDDIAVTLQDLPARMVPVRDGWYEATWDIAGPITVTDPSDDEDGRVDITFEQLRGEGLYAADYLSFLRLDVALGDFLVTPEGEDGALRIDLLEIFSDSQPIDGDRFDSASRGRLVGLSLTDDGEEVVRIAEIGFEGTVADADLAAIGLAQRRFSDLMQDDERLGDDGKRISRYHQLAELIEEIGYPIDGMEFSYFVNGVHFADEGFAGPELYELSHGQFGAGITGLRGATSTITVDFETAGLTATELPSPLSPRLVELRLALRDLPNAELMELVQDGLMVAGDAGPNLAMTILPFQLMEVVMSSDSALELRPSRIHVGDLDARMAGTLLPSPMAMLGFVADFQMEIAGMPETVSMLQAEGFDDPNILAMLTLIQSLGDQRTNAEGQAIRAYDVQVTEDGTILLNDTDLMPLIEGFL